MLGATRRRSQASYSGGPARSSTTWDHARQSCRRHRLAGQGARRARRGRPIRRRPEPGRTGRAAGAAAHHAVPPARHAGHARPVAPRSAAPHLLPGLSLFRIRAHGLCDARPGGRRRGRTARAARHDRRDHLPGHARRPRSDRARTHRRRAQPALELGGRPAQAPALHQPGQGDPVGAAARAARRDGEGPAPHRRHAAQHHRSPPPAGRAAPHGHARLVDRRRGDRARCALLRRADRDRRRQRARCDQRGRPGVPA